MAKILKALVRAGARRLIRGATGAVFLRSSIRPTWQGVTSTCARAIKYDPDASTLDVEFKSSGAQYRYFDVAKGTATRMERAGSVGRFFNRNVRNNYSYERLRGPVRSRRRKRHK